MFKLFMLVTFFAAACVASPTKKDDSVGCRQQAEEACSPTDKECKALILDDCIQPPPCTAPIGQHC